VSRTGERVMRIGCVVLAALALSLGSIALGVGRCGDGICEGPETPALCPEDCGLCETPNPRRAEMEDSLIWRDRLIDGSFESGSPDLTDDERAGQLAAQIERSADPNTRHDGAYGIRVETDASGGAFALQAKIDKGEETRFTAWIRSLGGPTEVRLHVLGLQSYTAPVARALRGLEEPLTVAVGPEWTQIELQFATTSGLERAFFAVELDPDTSIAIDEAKVEAEHWRRPEIEGPTRVVGGIEVPMEPAAPIHFNVLMHVEDPAALTVSEAYFRETTEVFTALAETLHSHGGFLTIQPEEDWPQGSGIFSAGRTLAELAQKYGVVYSTHTHGPACIGCLNADGPGAQGPRGCEGTERPLSNGDCSACPDCVRVVTDTDPYTPVYVENLRLLIEQASGTPVTDHNGNWKYENLSALADVGVRTLSAFKKAETQSTFDVLFTNPWRPTHASAVDDPEAFFVHDPTTQVIFIPGWGQAITRHPEYLQERLVAMLAQVISYADPDRVNTFYIVTHVGHFEPESEESYITVDPVTGRVTRGAAFERDLDYWETAMREVVDPLVAEGYVQWTSLPEIGELFVEWEADCANR